MTDVTFVPNVTPINADWLNDVNTTVNFTQSGTGAVTRPLVNRIKDTISVKDFGAVGDGITNDTTALNLAATALQNGQALFFPAGIYIVSSCILFRGKTDIDIYGSGKATIVRPANQGVAPIKQDYPSTLGIDQCSRVTLRSMVIESKGESYGNIDNYGGLAGGDPRTNAILNYGGSALVATRSDNVTMESVDSRLCGSCGVVYLSSCEDVLLVNCFANAGSLGYAGFAIDNFADSTVKTKRNYKLINCRVSKEGYTYSSKAGIAAEGDQTTGRLLNLDIIGGCYEDCSTGSNVLYLGAGISCFETRLTMSNVTTRSCYIGVTWQKRGGAVDGSWCRITGGHFSNCSVTGAYIAIGTATGGSDVSIVGTQMDIASSSVWSALTDNSVKYSSGITVPGYSNGEINVTGCKISGGQYGLWAIDSAAYNVTGSEISGSIASIWTYGGGTLKATGNRLTVTAGDRVVGRNTNNLAGAASYNLNTYVSNNLLECVSNTAADFGVTLNGSSTLFLETQIRNNALPKGVINASKGSATLYDVDTPTTWTPVVRGGGTAGTYELNTGAGGTRCTITKMGSLVTVNAYIVLAGTITAGGTGDLTVTGIPIPKRNNSSAFGGGVFSGVDFTAASQISAYFGTTSAASDILFWQTVDNTGVTLVPVSGVSAGDVIAFSITYEA